MMGEFERDITFRMNDVHDLTRPEIRERIMTRVNLEKIYFFYFKYFIYQIPSIIKYITNDSVEEFQKRLNILVLIDPGFLTRIGVHVKILLIYRMVFYA